MEIINYPEHESCVSYKAGLEGGFSFMVELDGTVLKDSYKSTHHLLFVMNGSIEVQCDGFPKVSVSSMETVFLPKSSSCYIKVIQMATLMLFSFGNNMNYIDRYLFQDLYKHTHDIEYQFVVYPVRGCISDFLELLVSYFDDGVNCERLHEMKQDELFLLFKKYYSKQELAQFFYPVIGADWEFKNRVLENYLNAKTVEELAGLIGYSTAELRRRFQENFHEPVYCWMQKQKCRHIQHEMLVGNDDMSTLAYRFGFSSSSHFNKFCKAQFGMTPTELKKKLKCIE